MSQMQNRKVEVVLNSLYFLDQLNQLDRLDELDSNSSNDLFEDRFNKKDYLKQNALHSVEESASQLMKCANFKNNSNNKGISKIVDAKTQNCAENESSTSTEQRCQLNSDFIVTLNRKDQLKDYSNHLESVSDKEFARTYGFCKATVIDIHRMINYDLSQKTQRGRPNSSMRAVLLTLQYLTSGTIQSKSAIAQSVSQSTISRLMRKVTTLLSELRLRFVKIPPAKQFPKIASEFQKFGGFPNVFGCIGSTHVPIKKPDKAVADDYLNENGFYSFRFWAVCGANLEFYEVVSRWPGASHENKIFNLSETYQRYEYTTRMEGILLASEQYACTDFVLTPYAHSTYLKSKYLKYNEAHEDTYIFPQAINLWKARFRCLQTHLSNHEETIQSIIMACAVLHNIAIQRKEPMPAELNSMPQKDWSLHKDAVQRKPKAIPALPTDLNGVLRREAIIAEYFDK